MGRLSDFVSTHLPNLCCCSLIAILVGLFGLSLFISIIEKRKVDAWHLTDCVISNCHLRHERGGTFNIVINTYCDINYNVIGNIDINGADSKYCGKSDNYDLSDNYKVGKQIACFIKEKSTTLKVSMSNLGILSVICAVIVFIILVIAIFALISSTRGDAVNYAQSTN